MRLQRLGTISDRENSEDVAIGGTGVLGERIVDKMRYHATDFSLN